MFVFLFKAEHEKGLVYWLNEHVLLLLAFMFLVNLLTGLGTVPHLVCPAVCRF